MKMEYKTLNNGVKIPMLGYGVFQINGKECERCVTEALDAGYRLIDTAQAYFNEEFVGNALHSSGVQRGDVFLTTKVWVTEHEQNRARASIAESMKKLRTDYLDLVLIHQPLGDYYSAYRALEELYKEGVIRAIGVSNFSPERLADLVKFNETAPAVNQVETHPFFQQYEAAEWMKKLGVAHEAWGPLAEHRVSELLSDAAITAIAAKHGKTPAQVVLRANAERGIISIPKTVSRKRMEENLNIFDFRLSGEEMEAVRSLDEGKSLWASYDDPNIVDLAMRTE